MEQKSPIVSPLPSARLTIGERLEVKAIRTERHVKELRGEVERIANTLVEREPERRTQDVKRFMTVKELVASSLTSVSDRTVRGWILRDHAGFNTRCVRRRGRRIYVDTAEMVKWMSEGDARTVLDR